MYVIMLQNIISFIKNTVSHFYYMYHQMFSFKVINISKFLSASLSFLINSCFLRGTTDTTQQ